MGVTDLQVLLDGKPVTPPVEWQDIKLQAAFGTNSTQPEIESDRFTLVNDAALSVLYQVEQGKIFEGLDASLLYRQRDLTVNVFDGFIDMGEELEIIEPKFGPLEKPNKVVCKFKSKDGVSNFLSQIQGVTYGFLLEKNHITKRDFVTINTAIDKKQSFLDIVTTIITIYLLSKQLSETIAEFSDDSAEAFAPLLQVPPQPSPGAFLAAAKFVIRAAYAVAIIVLLIQFIRDLINLILPPVLKNKGMNYRVLLEKACTYFGYTFVSPIEELDLYNYLPSKPFSNETNIIKDNLPIYTPNKQGIPNSGDFGYLITEMFELCKRMFNAKVDVIGREVHLRNEDDPFWLKQATYTPPININYPSKKYNTNQLFNTRLMSFLTDPNDDWTLENYTGTSYEVKTESINNNAQSTITGLDRIDIPVCLPNAKRKLSIVEDYLLLVAKVADAFSKLIGKKGNFQKRINVGRNNILKVSSNEYTIPKVVPLQGSNIPKNDRSILSAKFLIEKYYKSKSFVGDALGQKILYESVTIPFNLSDFQKTLKNGTFTLKDGRKARFINISYQLSSDVAEVDFEVQEKYTNRLREVTYEP